jgi:hypothetical protein
MRVRWDRRLRLGDDQRRARRVPMECSAKRRAGKPGVGSLGAPVWTASPGTTEGFHTSGATGPHEEPSRGAPAP